MKGIYKKLSVGVLAAALLVGGSGLAKGGQAFADGLKGIDYEIVQKERQAYEFGASFFGRSKEQIEAQKKRDSDSNIKLLEMYGDLVAKYKGEVGKVENDGIKVDKAYRDVFDAVLDEQGKKVNKRIQIGLFIYDIVGSV